MEPCYIVTYAITGACIVNTSSVVRRTDHPTGRCKLEFKNGSILLLDETCEKYDERTSECSPSKPPIDVPVYG